MYLNTEKIKIENLGLMGVYLFTLSLMASKSGMNIGLGFMALGSIFYFIKNKKVKLENEQKFFLFLLLFIPIISFLSPGGVESFKVAFQKNYRYLSFFFIPLYLSSYKIIERVTMCLYISIVINFINGMLNYKRNNWNFNIRYESFGNNLLDNAHVFAVLSFLILAMLIYSFIDKRIKTFIISTVIYILCLSALVLSQARGAWLAFLITGVVFSFFIIKNKKIFIAFVSAALVFGFMYLKNPNVNNRYVNRIRSIKNIKSDSPKIRTLMWEAAFNTYKENPIFGVGRDNFPSYVLEYLDKNDKYKEVNNKIALKNVAQAGNPHNMYFSSLVEEGIGSFVLFGFWLYILWNEYILLAKLKLNNKKEYLILIGCICATIAFYLSGLTEDSWRNIWKANAYMLIISLYLSMKKIENVRKNKE